MNFQTSEWRQIKIHIRYTIAFIRYKSQDLYLYYKHVLKISELLNTTDTYTSLYMWINRFLPIWRHL